MMRAGAGGGQTTCTEATMTQPYCYEYPRPAVTVDLAVFARVEGEVRVLMIRRKHDPFAGRWALPGGFLEMDETARNAAARELHEETGLADPGEVEFLGVYDRPDRDPRGRTISLAHAAILAGQVPEVAGGDDAEQAAWLHPQWLDRPTRGARGLPPLEGPELAFDHAQILADALDWLSTSVWLGGRAVELLPPVFDLGHIHTLADQIAPIHDDWDAERWLQRQVAIGEIKATHDGYRRARPEEVE